ncbi:MAG: hypothetical protein ACI4QM_00640 [Alphaproteobacteria bacterium]
MCVMLMPAVVAEAACLKSKTPRITVRANQGRVKYVTSQSRKEFIAKFPGTPDTTLGLTVAALGVKISGIPRIQQNAHQVCVNLKEVTFEIGYDVIDVYIDRKYKPGSCEYRVIRDHEDYHVAVYRKAMTFFQPDIEKALRASVKKMSPVSVTTQAEAERILSQQFNQIQKDIAPLLKHINSKIAQKNAAIDTPESYAAANALCKNW